MNTLTSVLNYGALIALSCCNAMLQIAAAPSCSDSARDSQWPSCAPDGSIAFRFRQAGYATDDEESEVGMRGIAAPIRDISGKVIAAVSLAGPIQRLTKKDMRSLATQVINTADAISLRLGYKAR